jgi:hypothetical protein
MSEQDPSFTAVDLMANLRITAPGLIMAIPAHFSDRYPQDDTPYNCQDLANSVLGGKYHWIIMHLTAMSFKPYPAYPIEE